MPDYIVVDYPIEMMLSYDEVKRISFQKEMILVWLDKPLTNVISKFPMKKDALLTNFENIREIKYEE